MFHRFRVEFWPGGARFSEPDLRCELADLLYVSNFHTPQYVYTSQFTLFVVEALKLFGRTHQMREVCMEIERGCR